MKHRNCWGLSWIPALAELMDNVGHVPHCNPTLRSAPSPLGGEGWGEGW
jgi:hypothetical protein